MKKTTIITHRDLSNHEVFILPFIHDLVDGFPADIIYVEDFSSSVKLADYLNEEPGKLVNIFFVRFRWLIDANGLHKKSRKLRVVYEQDAAQNYQTVASSVYIGAWTKYLPLLFVDLIVVTDKVTRDRLAGDGIPAYWLPKAVDAAHFSIDQPIERQYSIGYYGSVYGARARALATMRRSGLGINVFSVDYQKLPLAISRHRAVLICNAASSYTFPRFRSWQKKFPLLFVRPTQAWQVMAKNYEVCMANSLMLADYIGEMDELGFESEKNCLLYRNDDEMIEMALWTVSHVAEAEVISANGRRHVLERHTWRHRSSEFIEFIRRTYLS